MNEFRKDARSSRVTQYPRWLSLKTWEGFLWLLAAGAFGVAMLASCRAYAETARSDLRTPWVLLGNGFLAASIAFAYAFKTGALTRGGLVFHCFRFGLWSAAVFRLLPLGINEENLFLRDMGNFDLPYGVMGVCIHGGMTALLVFPFATRLLYPPEDRRLWAGDNRPWELCGSVILTFFIFAGLLRLLATSR